MKALKDTIVGWVDQRLEDMLAAPRMWGSDEAIEMQALLLLEMRALAMRPEQELADPRRILDAYNAYLAKQFPEKPHRPLFQIVPPDDVGFALAAELRKFLDAFVPSMLEENPFQPVALRAEHERRIVEVIVSNTRPEPFERQDEIRGIDLDRGLVVLGKKTRLPCYVRPEQLGDIALVGVQARVRGSLLRPWTGRPFVLVDAIELLEPTGEDES